MKAFEGFADRLQALSHLLDYCILHDATLCVDWRDENWGQNKWDFSDFFDIVGVKTISLNDLPKEGTIVPSTWTHEDIMKPMDRRFLDEMYNGPLMKDSTEKIEGDILVTNSKGFRRFHITNIANNIRFKQSIMNKIQENLANFYLPCTVVHLRGTDRYDSSTIAKQFEVYNTLLPHEKARVYVISDSKSLLDEWIQIVPNSIILNKHASVFKLPEQMKKGSHQLSEEVLEFYGIDKYTLIVEALTDFVALSYASWVIGNVDSVFFYMSRFLNQMTTDHLSQIFYGYKPERRPLTSVPSST